MHKVQAFYQQEWFLYSIAMLMSLLLSFTISQHEAIINPDAICYLLSAEAIGDSGIHGAMQLCGQAKWPFYSVLIYGVVKTTHLSYLTAAYLLNAIFSLLSVVTFIFIVKELGGSRRVMWLSAFVILLSHEFNSVREYIVRDHGFWAFYLVSLLCLLRYFHHPRWFIGLAFSVSLLIATLFRIEGAIFLIALPFLSLLCTSYSIRMRMKLFFTLNVPLILIGLLLAIWLISHPQQTLSQWGRIAEIGHHLQSGLMMIAKRYEVTKLVFTEHVLTNYSAKDVNLVLFIMLFGWYLVSIISNVSWIYSFLIVYAWFQKALKLTSTTRLVLIGYLLVNVGVTLGFLLEEFFLSKRYLIALSLILMLWVPFALDYLIRHGQSLRYRLLLAFTIFFIFISSLGGILNFGHSKMYIHNAGDWIANHVPATASLYANDAQLMYYSQHFGNAIFEKIPTYSNINTIAHGAWKKYDYIAIRLNKKEENKLTSILQEIKQTPIQVFSNTRGDKVIIYKIHP